MELLSVGVKLHGYTFTSNERDGKRDFTLRTLRARRTNWALFARFALDSVQLDDFEPLDICFLPVDRSSRSEVENLCLGIFWNLADELDTNVVAVASGFRSR